MVLIMVVIGVLVFLTALDTGQWPAASSEGCRDARDRQLPKRVTPRRKRTAHSASRRASGRGGVAARWWWE